MLNTVSLQINEPNRLNIMDLHRKINQRNEKKSRCYEKVLELCNKRILNSTERDKTACVFEFPEYVIGYPLFDLNACMQHCQKQLVASGFLVQYYFPNKFYISWDFEEIKHHRMEQRKQIPLVSMIPQKSLKQSPAILQQNDIVHNTMDTRMITQQTQNNNPSNPTILPSAYKSTPIASLSTNAGNADYTSHPQVESLPMSAPTHVQQPINIDNIANVKPENPTFWPKQPLPQAPSSLQARMVAPLPLTPPKYDPFDVFIPQTQTPSTGVHKTGTSASKASAIDNTFYANNFKHMLASGIGGNKQMFDYKPSGKLSLNLG